MKTILIIILSCTAIVLNMIALPMVDVAESLVQLSLKASGKARALLEQ